QWALEKRLTILGSSDIHGPTNLYYDFEHGDHRPITLVFAKQRAPAAIKKALFAGRTAAYADRRLTGAEKYLRPIFENSVEIINPAITLVGTKNTYVRIRNHSSIPYELEAVQMNEHLTYTTQLTIHPERTVLLRVRSTSEEWSGGRSQKLPFVVTNLLTGPEQRLRVEFELRIEHVPASN
ncbi:MAG: hypothetical protein JSW54_01305, partial [Fidelibacterota bacterium]